MATRSSSFGLGKLIRTIDPGRLLEAGFQYESGDEVPAEVDGEVRTVKVEDRLTGPRAQALFQDGAPRYEVSVIEYEELSSSVQEDYEIELKPRRAYREVVSEDDIL